MSTCDHDWQLYWDGSLGYRETDCCMKCGTYRPTPQDGAGRPPEAAPRPARVPSTVTPVTQRQDAPTPGEQTAYPDPPHSGEQEKTMDDTTTTPEQRRDAWLKLVAMLEGRILSTREHARSVLDISKKHADTYQMPAPALAHWEATFWAADRLLAQVRELAAPVVPEDPAKGQATILEALSTPGEKAVEEPPVHFVTPLGTMLHALGDPMKEGRFSTQLRAQVTCGRCASILDQEGVAES